MATMKLRIRGNSIRFRLTQTEVARLRSSETVRESVSFPGTSSRFFYSLDASDELAKISASFHDGEVRVAIPVLLIQSWAQGDQVGMEENELLTDGGKLRVLIEKDFRCLEPRPGEDETDNFAHPVESSAECETEHPLS